MSTNDILVRRAAEAARIEDLRRLEAEQAERERQRLGLANQAVSQLDQRYRALVSHRDEAASRLPDLQFLEPAWPDLPAQVGQNAAALEGYVGQVRSLVSQFETQLSAAIEEAQAVLTDRLARAQAWREAQALEQAVQISQQHLAAACQAVQESVPQNPSVSRPTADASLVSLQHYLVALKAHVATIQQQTAGARRRFDTRCMGQSLAGTLVAAGSTATDALAHHASVQRSHVQQALQATLKHALTTSGLTLADLPQGTQILLNAAADVAESNATQRERIQRLVARERVLKEHVTNAERLLKSPPELVHAHPKRARRWATLVQQLEAVCSGRAAYSPHLDLEYGQIKADAQRDLDRRYVQTEFVGALRDQDFHALSDEHGRLVIEDLKHHGVWLEETQPLDVKEGERGGIATVLELKTDAPATDVSKDEKVISSVCERLQAVGQSSAKVRGEHTVLDRKERIQRAKRPTVLKTFNAQI